MHCLSCLLPLVASLPAGSLSFAREDPEASTEEVPKFSIELAAEAVTVPFDASDGHVNVAVAIDGAGSYRFQVDTYASVFGAIDDDLVAELNLEVVGQWPNSDGKQVVMRDVVHLGEVTFGGVTLHNVMALVDDYDFVDTGDGTLQGLIGFPSLRRHLVTFDYPNSELRFETGRLEEGAPYTLPFQVTTGSPDLLLEIGGEEVVVGLDTGSTMGLLLDRTHVARLGVEDTLMEVGNARSVYSTQAIERAVLPHPLDLGGHLIEPPAAIFFDFPSPRGLLGHDILRSFAVTFDGRSRLVRFVLPPQPTGIDLTPDQLAAFVGTYVFEDSRYELRLWEGSLLFVEDNLPPLSVLALTPTELRLRANPTRLELDQREGEPDALILRTHAGGSPRRALRRPGDAAGD